MQHHEPESHAEKLVRCLQCQGHSEGIYDHNITSPFVACWSVCNQTLLDSTKCHVEKWVYCVQGQGHSEG